MASGDGKDCFFSFTCLMKLFVMEWSHPSPNKQQHRSLLLPPNLQVHLCILHTWPSASAACAAPHRMEMVLSGLVAASLLSTCDAIFTSSLEEHSTYMSCRSTIMIGGAGFSADGNKVRTNSRRFGTLPLHTKHQTYTSVFIHYAINIASYWSGNETTKWHISHQKASTDSATFLELVSVEFHLGLCDRTKQLQPHYS
ncbi:hypothetical protein EMCRGX_G028022 [Ephydatia muelleri]